jgi:hypothetical protein
MKTLNLVPCPYCGEYHFNYCAKQGQVGYKCVICDLPIGPHEAHRGMGSGSDEYLKQQFAHEMCYWRHSTEKAERLLVMYETHALALARRAKKAESEVARLSALIANIEHPEY